MSPEEEKGCDIVHSVQQTISCNSSKAIAPQASFEADLLSDAQLRWGPCTEPEMTSQNKTATDLKDLTNAQKLPCSHQTGHENASPQLQCCVGCLWMSL